MLKKKVLSGLLCAAMMLSVVSSAFAVETPGGTGSVPATITQDGTVFSVTVPTGLPVSVDAKGVETTATNVQIVNNSYGPILVSKVAVTPLNDWTIAAFAKDFTKEKVGLKEFGLVLNSDETATNGSLTLTPANWGSIAGKGSLPISYQANVAIQKAAQAVTIANVVFTVGWDENSGDGAYTDGQVVRMGTLHVNGAAQAMPTNPVDGGNIQRYNGTSQLAITDTVADKALQFIAVKIDGKQLFVCDRNIVANISWNQLNSQSLITGKEVTIDGQKYKLRVLTGGAKAGNPCEWDKMMAAVGAENTIWHWKNMYSLCQERSSANSELRALRGYFSAASWIDTTATYNDPGYGWRPVLEVL